ncbi:MAG: serine O-acetyltransferase [Methylotenera sp.]|nr:serine O-acetyltransferase [Oligoflexia bacterium]
MLSALHQLLRAYQKNDPAARSWAEILFLYPGIKAIAFHRVAHALHVVGIPFLPRFLSELSRWLTGIEIHPGATLGAELVIDHGMGVVIGETAIVGNQVLIYHGVTLGGTSLAAGKRHPTLGDRVIVGSGAKILGNITIGDESRIGSNSVVTHSVPASSTVVGIPGRIVARPISAGEPGYFDYSV